MLQEKYGKEFHPIMNLAKIANDPDAEINIKFNANKEIAKYVCPQLRAVEYKGEIDASEELKSFLSTIIPTIGPPSER